MNWKVWAIIVTSLVGVGVFVYLHTHEAPQELGGQATTTVAVAHCDNDAKLCPDGSAVLRSGPQCEFAACPSMFGEVRDWQNRKDPVSDISFKYPVTLGSQYVTAREWPPTVRESTDVFTCEPGVATDGGGEVTAFEEVYEEETYCVKEQREGAAGSTYVSYQVTVRKNDTYLTLAFTVQFPQCLNYDGGEQSICLAAQKSFNVLELVAGIVATATQ